MKLYEVTRICSWKQQSKDKMKTFVLPTYKRLIVSFWTFFQISRQPQRIRKNQNWRRNIFQEMETR